MNISNIFCQGSPLFMQILNSWVWRNKTKSVGFKYSHQTMSLTTVNTYWLRRCFQNLSKYVPTTAYTSETSFVNLSVTTIQTIKCKIHYEDSKPQIKFAGSIVLRKFHQWKFSFSMVVFPQAIANSSMKERLAKAIPVLHGLWITCEHFSYFDLIYFYVISLFGVVFQLL